MSWRADVAGSSLNIAGEYAALGRAMEVAGLLAGVAAGVVMSVACFYATALLRRVPRSALPWWFSLAGWIIGVAWLLATVLTLAERFGWLAWAPAGNLGAMDAQTAVFLSVVVSATSGCCWGSCSRRSRLGGCGRSGGQRCGYGTERGTSEISGNQ